MKTKHQVECKHEHFSQHCNSCGLDILKEHDTKLVDAVEGLKVINHRLKDDSDNFEQMIYAENRGHNKALQDAVNIIKGV